MGAITYQSPFAGIRDAVTTVSSRRLEIGQYLVKIQQLRFFRSRKDPAHVFVADLEVVESDNPNFKPGDKVGYVTKQGKFANKFLANIRGFLAAAGKVQESEVDEECADMAVSDQQPFVGDTLRCVVTANAKDAAWPVHTFLPA